MSLWERYFELCGLTVAQVLLTRQDIEDRLRYLNVRDTFNALLQRGIVPVVNENDAVATDEIKIGDNDNLSALIALAYWDYFAYNTLVVRVERVVFNLEATLTEFMDILNEPVKK